ncbi:choice-of-anchor tandem repeat GloVer-containing protein [Adhaeribacter pallidiroseus]|uniref:Secretion system C-terminal sorting domain-containing protein n=1 Tax=Adhaeribacter pallidiroseus TaxID=2072847 RepID=A0A369QIA7_9BACT|nr:choice-of-anchor tandem repeat GloVer-containing protein [Adhaeribacter pallidiroseus]RDC63325.1 hypothetical protein AHMF7616_01928 [Adhaeribacter pallidiroseus]
MKSTLLLTKFFPFAHPGPSIARFSALYRKLGNFPLIYYCSILAMGLILSGTPLRAQDELLGLTSVGGSQGAGTAFGIKSNGSGFNVQKTFVESGYYPYGNLIKGSDGNYYGMTYQGGHKNYGSIFKMTPGGSVTILVSLDYYITGGNPRGSLLQGADGNFYGMTYQGGASGYGTIFKVTPAGTFTLLRNFNGELDGRNPEGSLVQSTDGNLYGLTRYGGSKKYGTIFKISPSGTFTVLKSFDYTTSGGYPRGSLVRATDGNFYGMTYQGGTSSYGTIFRITPAGVFTVRRNLDYSLTGGYPQGSLIQATNGSLYGMTYQGGSNGYGTIFRLTLAGAFSVIRNLSSALDGSYPLGDLIQGSDNNLYGLTSNGGSFNSGTIFKITTGGAYTVLHHLDNINDGRSPQGSLVQGTGNNFYGMTLEGGPGKLGTVFRVSSAGAFSVLTSFPEAGKGQTPQGSLIQARNGSFYGFTSSGGVYNQGTVFKLCDGVYSTVYSFNAAVSGSNPQGDLVQGADNNFYGMTQDGGTASYGTIFKLTPGGTLTVLRHLVNATDGGRPKGNLIQHNNNFFGMTTIGGANNNGTIFRISPSGAFQILKNLDNATTGSNPQGSLVLGQDGNFYGMTSRGGSNNYGTVFKITPAGTLTVLRNLDSTNDGRYPEGSLIQATDGNFYGLTNSGGLFGYGTLFKITTGGVYTVLHHFDFYNDGGRAVGSLVQGSGNNLYGLTPDGGYFDAGTIFKITTTGTFSILRQLEQTTDGGLPTGELIVRKANPIANAQTVTTTEETAKAITLVGSASGTPLIYSIVTPPQNGTLSGGTGANRTYTPKANFSGQDSFTFKVIWGCQESAIKTVSITVTNLNDAPVLAAIGDKNAAVGSKLSFTATATDADAGQTKTFSLIGAPAGASINASSGTFTWTPTAEGSYFFKIKVTDNGTPQLSDEEIITVTVSASLVRLASQQAKSPEPEKVNTVELYPNPAVQTITVNLPEPVSTLSTIISNAAGSSVLVNKHQLVTPQQVQVNVEQLPAGLYLFKVDLNHKLETLKFIKQ